MHLLYYTHNVLEPHRLSTGVSVAILVGAGWGVVRLVTDVITLATGGLIYPRRERE